MGSPRLLMDVHLLLNIESEEERENEDEEYGKGEAGGDESSIKFSDLANSITRTSKASQLPAVVTVTVNPLTTKIESVSGSGSAIGREFIELEQNQGSCGMKKKWKKIFKAFER
ncbi:hypothetical protein L6452_34533 [Arctium lappa]|uniref:Uncharacterized protein n=1 Tax=Arctium lappa TaxID=4217 RepID=A0ACB8YIE7_ARCLA|nr:hypothetical protein L6452_34533 [Arctium lappa]